jgi:NAD-dependent dihydropyrimidine dehydrogenase PreA subunit
MEKNFLSRIYKSLEEKSFLKLIIGAALKDFNAIENYAYEFTKLEPDLIDISAFPSSIIFAKKGIERALQENPMLKEPLLMISINSSEDPHFRRVEINWNACTECLACIPQCPSEAFYTNLEQNFNYNIDLCFGCSNCLDYCNYEALSFNYWKPKDLESLDELYKLGAQAIEIHLGRDLEAFKNYYRRINTEKLLESFSIGSELLNDLELRESLDCIYQEVRLKHGFHKHIIIQSDGIPLSGALEMSLEKDQISINNSKILIEYSKSKNFKNIFFQLSGGTTENSLKKAHRQGVMVHGVAIGSYARKLISQKSKLSILELS